jgi:hypothetical protein
MRFAVSESILRVGEGVIMDFKRFHMWTFKKHILYCGRSVAIVEKIEN